MKSSDLKILQDTNLATNDAHEITAAKLREVTTELIKSTGGWADYSNSSTREISPDEPSAWLTLTNDGEGAQTNDDFIPYYLTSLWSDNKVQLRDIQLGTIITLRFDIKLNITRNNTDVLFRIVFKDSEGTEVYTHLFDYRSFKSTGTLSGVNFYEFYVGESILNGTAEIQIQADHDISALLNGILISIP
jgi:hypothetical protein